MDLSTLVEKATTNKDELDLKLLITTLFGEEKAEIFYEKLKNT
ncbi:hypothetical protein [Cytobacillus horneckiae]|nr:hypothetical protein [Cytobacillus horneckiae]